LIDNVSRVNEAPQQESSEKGDTANAEDILLHDYRTLDGPKFEEDKLSMLCGNRVSRGTLTHKTSQPEKPTTTE